MKTIKDILNFCNAAIFHDYENERITEEINRVRKYIISTFISQFQILSFSQVCLCLMI